MSLLLYGPPNLDEGHWIVTCQHPECSAEREAAEMIQCHRCELCWCPEHWWHSDHEICEECLLLDYARLDRAMWHLKQDVFTAAQAELVKGRA
jgi:hypothetical protein